MKALTIFFFMSNFFLQYPIPRRDFLSSYCIFDIFPIKGMNIEPYNVNRNSLRGNKNKK